MDRDSLADFIVERLTEIRERIALAYRNSRNEIGHFVVDDLFPEDVALALHRAFPQPRTLTLKRSPREFKYVTAQMDRCDPLVEKAIYAFQDRRVVSMVAEITGIEDLDPDVHLYAGGISMMGHRQYLSPHVDNSHDHERKRWRVLNLLYYVTPGWEPEWGGNLELWPHGVKGEPLTVHSRFNRLAVMATHQNSWHSVSPITHDAYRCCVSNYYFSQLPLRETDRFHVTTFRGRPEQRFRDWLLRADGKLRAGLRMVFRSGVAPVTHIYRR